MNIPAPVYDVGTVTLTVAGVPVATANYGPGATSSSVALALINASAGKWVATLQIPNGSCTDCILMTSIDAGTGSDYSYSVSSTHSSSFAYSSFSAYPVAGNFIGGGGSSPLNNWSVTKYAPDGDIGR